MKRNGMRVFAILLAAVLIILLGAAALAEEDAPVDIAAAEDAEDSEPVQEAAPVQEQAPTETAVPEETPPPAETETPAPTEEEGSTEPEDTVSPTPASTPEAGNTAQTLDFLPLEIKTELPGALKAGSKTKLEVEIMNVLGRPMREIMLTLWSEDDRFEFVPDEDAEKTEEKEAPKKIVFVKSLEPGERKKLELEILPLQEIAESAQELKAKVKCDFQCDSREYISEDKWTMPFAQKPTETEAPSDSDDNVVTYYSGGGGGGSDSTPIDSVTPYIIIQSYRHSQKIYTGDDFTAEITLLNTSQKLDLEGVIATVETSEGITLSNGTNTLYIGDIAKGSTSTQSLSLMALPDCKEQTQKISLSLRFEYVDNRERKQGSSTETISLPIYQKDRLELQTPTFDYMTQYQEGVISIPYVNKGRSTLYNAEAVLSLEDAEVVQSAIYTGNIESGKNGTLDFIVTPQRDGEFSGLVTITYEDETQEEKSVEVPITFTAEAMVEYEPDYTEDLYAVEEENGSSFPIIPVAAGGGALVLIALLVLIHIRKKAKKRAAELAEDDWLKEDQ